eukprot:450244_1
MKVISSTTLDKPQDGLQSEKSSYFWQDHWDVLLCMAVVQIAYFITAYPTVSGGDSGELLVSACNLGVAHPPGYPLFTLLAHAFIRFIPFGCAAWRVNFMSTILGSLTAGMIMLTVKKISYVIHEEPQSDVAKFRFCWSGFFAALSFSFSHTPWLYNIQAEVFSLNNMLVSVIAYLGVRYFEMLGDCTLYLGCFVCGLALSNQHTSVFYVTITAFCVILSNKNHIVHWKRLTGITIAILIGISPYYYVFWASQSKPMDSWGDQRSLNGFLRHFLRSEYGTFQLGPGQLPESTNSGFVARIFRYAQNMRKEFGDFMPGMAVVGTISFLFRYFSSDKRSKLRSVSWFIFVHLVLAWAFYVVGFHCMANLGDTPLMLGVQARFWPQANIYVCIVAGVGLSWVQRVFSKITTPFVIHSLVASLVLSSTFWRWETTRILTDHHTSYLADSYGRSMLESLPRHSLMLVNGDINNNAVKYLQQCEGLRKDIDIVGVQQMSWEWFIPMQSENYPKVVFPGTIYHPNVDGGFWMVQFLDANFEARKIFICGPFKENDDSWQIKYNRIPFGLCDKISKKSKSPKNILRFMRASWGDLPGVHNADWHPSHGTSGTWEHLIVNDVWTRRFYLLSYAAWAAGQNSDNLELLVFAKDLHDKTYFTNTTHPMTPLPDHFLSAGVVYGTYSSLSSISEKDIHLSGIRMILLWQKYLQLGGDRNDIRQIVTSQINPYAKRSVSLEDIGGIQVDRNYIS